MTEEHEPERLTPDEWLSGFEQRYLSDYVPSGGSVVRFISGDEPTLAHVRKGLERIVSARDYHYRFLDAGALRPDGKPPNYHLIDRFYGGVTEGVDWQGWARRQAKQCLERLGVNVPPQCDLGHIEQLAASNGMDRGLLIQRYERAAHDAIQERTMTVEFRSAVTNLWVDQLLPDTSSPGRGAVLTTWLGGKTPPPGGARVLRSCQIYGKITSANARHYLVSFCEWARRTGRSGVLAVLDFRAYEQSGRTRSRSDTVLSDIQAAIERGESLDAVRAILEASRASAPSIIYSRSAYEQMLSLLRRFIDEIDRVRGMALVVLTSPEYFAPPAPKARTYIDYNALHTRIGDEVSDRRMANQDAALARLWRETA